MMAMFKLSGTSLVAAIADPINRHFIPFCLQTVPDILEIKLREGCPRDVLNRATLTATEMMMAIDIGIVPSDPRFQEYLTH